MESGRGWGCGENVGQQEDARLWDGILRSEGNLSIRLGISL